MCGNVLRVKSMSAEDCNEDHKCHDISARNPKIDDAHQDQKHRSRHDRKHRSLSDRSTDISDQHTHCIDCLARFQIRKRRRSGHSVIDKICHLPCERNQQKTTCCKSRVHKVLTEPSEKLFHDKDRKYRTKRAHPERKCRRQVQCQKQSRHKRTTVFDRNRFVHQLFIYVLCQHRCTGRNNNKKPCILTSEIIDSEKCCRQQCDHDQQHDVPRCCFITDMR